VEKCPYCDFNSHKIQGSIPEHAYIGRLLDDLSADLEGVQDRPIKSIFIGGGTPSVITAEGIQRLLDGVRKRVTLTADCEITLEANPGTFEVERFGGFIKAGVNRLSIGIQSLNAEHLRTLGRIHDPQQARTAAAHASELSLKSFNLDLMHGLPGQSAADALSDLEGVIALNPPHISWYQLTIEPNTLFASRPPTLPDDDTLWAIYQRGHEALIKAGYQQYEVSAYCKPSHQSVHNTNYWQFGDYLGIGCGAHSKITIPEQDTILRCEKIKHPQGYLDLTRALRYREWHVEPEERSFEFFMNQFRLFQPVSKQQFERFTGLSVEQGDSALEEAIAKGWVESTSDHWQLTPLGHRFLNDVLTTLLSET
tara:strand:+ start:8440 stop:9540 length:1101 start_codon:yes stop_codon:yes gene_type:complete